MVCNPFWWQLSPCRYWGRGHPSGNGWGSGWGWAGSPLGLSIGVIYQKKFCDEMDLRTGMAVQTAAAAIAMWFVSSWLETGAIDWTGEFIFAFVWLSVVLSLGAITLLLYLIRRGQAARVSSLFFLVPPAAAVFSYFMFDETFGPIALIGMIVSVIGVAFVNRFS